MPAPRKRKEPPPPPPAVALTAPAGISKSMVTAMRCPHYFVHQYLRGSRELVVSGPLAQTGTEFHAWRSAYIEHLVKTDKWQDPAFADAYIERHQPSDDAQILIRRDAETFRVNPDSVYATELFLSVDSGFRPLEEIRGRAPGQLSSMPAFLLCGQLDIVLIDGSHCRIVDPKTGFSTATVGDDEPALYAALIFSHFPQVDSIDFVWDFVRMRSSRPASYTRADFGWIQEHVRALNATKDVLVRMAAEGKPMEANPWSGLCSWCTLRCPLRGEVEAGRVQLGPVQTEEDARRLAQFVAVCEAFLPQARKLLKPFMESRPALPLGADFELVNRVSERSAYALVDALQVLGLDIIDTTKLPEAMREQLDRERPAWSPRYDVPLHSLTASASKLNSFAKSKKSKRRADGGGVSREGMAEQLDAIADTYPVTKLVIRRTSVAPELEALLEASLEEAGDA